jgi:putative transposase
MPNNKRYMPEEIVAKLRQFDVLVSRGQNIADASRQIGVREVTYYRWQKEYGGLKTEQVKRLKELETENAGLLPLSKRLLRPMVTRQQVHRMMARPALYAIKSARRAINVHNSADEFCRGVGLEVGALSVPFKFSNAKVRYADIASSIKE